MRVEAAPDQTAARRLLESTMHGLAPDAIEDGGLFLWLTVLLVGPVACSVYFLIEQLFLALRRRRGASNNSLERDAAKPRASG